MACVELSNVTKLFGITKSSIKSMGRPRMASSWSLSAHPAAESPRCCA